MTSANVTIYRIEKNGIKVGEHYFHYYCKPKWEQLERFQPLAEHTITSTHEDEEENYHEGKPVGLDVFLNKIKEADEDIKRRMRAHRSLKFYKQEH